MDARQERGLQIAQSSKIVKTPVGWKVPSQSGNGTYVVSLDHGHPFCTCPDFESRPSGLLIQKRQLFQKS